MPQLQVIEGPLAGSEFVVDHDSAVLGRLAECDIVLDSGAVSRQHARISRQDGHYYIEDLQSRNGTYVNGRPVREKQALSHNDRITLCDVVMLFLDVSPNKRTAVGGATLSLIDGGAMMVDDEKSPDDGNVIGRLDVSTRSAGLGIQVNPEAKLKAVLEISHNLGQALEVNEVLPKVLDSLLSIFPQADRGVIVLREGPKDHLVPRAVKHRRSELVDSVRVSRTIVRDVIAKKTAILSADAANDSRFSTSESIVDFQIRSVMCAPLVTGEGKVLGVIQIDTLDQRNRFSDNDLDVLASVASQAAIAVDNAGLHETALREQAVRRELNIAHKVLRNLLPNSPPNIPGYDFFYFYEPANELGGDYYTVIKLPGGRIAVVVADVSGKGIPAALVMASLSGDVRYCLVSEPLPADAVSRLNQLCCEAGWEDRFVTFVLAILDPVRHEITFVDAGHPPPLIRIQRQGKVIRGIEDEQSRLPLGVSDAADYAQVVFKLEPGDCIALYTDGFTEAMNEKDELYGLERLWKQMQTSTASVSELGGSLLSDVKQFVGKRAQSDDMCLVCFGRE